MYYRLIEHLNTMRTYEVYLNIYDFTSSNKILSSLGLPIYHTGVEINEVEFCYCVVSSDGTCSGVIMIEPETAQYTFQTKQFIGELKMQASQLQKIIDNLSQKYTCGSYHAFRQNCNHFSDQLLRALLGQGIPKNMFRMTNWLKCLCCCLPENLLNGKWAIKALEDVLNVKGPSMSDQN